MSCYVVVQEAVYMHGTFGPFDTEQEARDAADAMALNECEDGHHYYVVRSMTQEGGLSKPLYVARGEARHIRWRTPCYDGEVDRRSAVGRSGSESSPGDFADVPCGPTRSM